MGIDNRDYMNSRRSAPSSGGGWSPHPSIPNWLLPVAAAVLIVAGVWYGSGKEDRPEHGLAGGYPFSLDRQTAAAGSFEVRSGRVVAADPELTAEAVRAGKLAVGAAALDGTWKFTVSRQIISYPGAGSRKYEGPLLELQAVHSSIADEKSLTWTSAGEAEIHGRLCGIFDAGAFRDASGIGEDFAWTHPPEKPEDRWYSACADVCRGLAQSGGIPGGAVARAPRGRGTVSTATQADGKVTAIRAELEREMDPASYEFDEYLDEIAP